MQIVCSEFPTESLDGHDRYILGDSVRVCVRLQLTCTLMMYHMIQTVFLLKSVLIGIACHHGRDTSPDEIRLNIIKELVSHKDSYLNKEYLSRGLACPQKTILKSFAMYSDEYEHGTVLTNTVIENIYEQETKNIYGNLANVCLV